MYMTHDELKSDSRFRKFFLVMFEKIPSFICLVFQNENERILKEYILFF